MRKYAVIMIFLFACNLRGLSQQYVSRMKPDSLKNALLVAKDTQRVNILNLLSKRILYNQVQGYLDSAARLSAEALTLSKKLRFVKGTGNALLNQAIISVHKTEDFHTTLSSLQTALPLLKKSGDWTSVAECFSVTGECYHYLGENSTAIIFYDSCVLLTQQLGDTTGSVWNIIRKGHSYYDLGNYSDAYKTFHTAQELTPKNDTILQCFSYSHLAILFVGANLPEIAIEYMNKARALYPNLTPAQQKKLPWPLNWVSRMGGEAFLQLNQIDSAFKIATAINIPLEEQQSWENLFYGHLYSAMGQYEKALIYFKHGYKSSQHAFHEIAVARQANELATTYLELKDFSQAMHYANEALGIAEKIHALLEQKNAVGTLSSIYAATKNYTKAYQYNQLYKSLNDSLAPEEYKRKLSLIQIKDQLEMQKKEAQLLSSQNQINQQQIKIQESVLKRKSLLLYIFITTLVVGLVLIILVARNLKLKKREEQLQQLIKESDLLLEQKRKEQQVAALEKEKSDLEMFALRAQMNPHFIFNCLSSINRFILINKTEEASDYLTKFSRLIRMALHNSEKSFITLESELDALRLYLDLERLRFKNAFNYSITLINTIDVSAVFIPPLLIQPFTENAIWHGLMHKEGIGSLDITLSVEEKILTCIITDDGIGRNEAARLKSKSAEKNKGMGIQITTERLALLNRAEGVKPCADVVDLVDSEGNACGTQVVLKMKYKDLTEASEY